MEKRILGLLLTLLGAAGLILAGYSFLHSSGNYSARQTTMYGILGFLFFISGVGLIRNTKDKAT